MVTLIVVGGRRWVRKRGIPSDKNKEREREIERNGETCIHEVGINKTGVNTKQAHVVTT